MTTVPGVLVALALVGSMAAPAAAADPGQTFTEQCAKCHGESGHADTKLAGMLKVPALPGDAKVAGASVTDLVATVKENAKHPKSIKELSDEQLTAAVTRAKELANTK